MGMNGTLGERLRLIRKEKKMTQEQLEERSGVSQSTISAIERGDQLIDGLGSGNLFKLCATLEVSPLWLGLGVGEKSAQSLNPRITELLEAVESLDDANLGMIVTVAKSLKK